MHAIVAASLGPTDLANAHRARRLYLEIHKDPTWFFMVILTVAALGVEPETGSSTVARTVH